MNQRERILAIAVLTVVILAVGGFLFKWLFLDALNRVYADIDAAKADIAKKQDEERKEQDDENALLRDDPRLAQWKVLSLPEDSHLDAEVKSGRSADEEKKRHDDNVQVAYQRLLNNLVVDSGFSPGSIKVSAAAADRKGGPILSGKTAAYTRMTFTVQAQGGLDSVQRMLEEFYRTPLLHQVRTLTLTSRAPARPTGPGAGPGGFPRFPGAAPPGVPGLPGAAPGGVPGLAGGLPSGSPNGDLDVSMTVEALLVAGAQKRDDLLPKSTDLKPLHTLAYTDDEKDVKERQYSDMLAKNMFTGISAATKLSEDRDQVLSGVRLTAIWNNGKYWQATILDQNKPPDPQTGDREMRLKFLRGVGMLDEFSIVDVYKNVLVRGKALKLDADGLIFQADGKYYRWQCGEYLGRRLASVKSSAPSAGPFSAGGDEPPQYILGVLDKPLKSDEIKALGLSPSSSTAEK